MKVEAGSANSIPILHIKGSFVTRVLKALTNMNLENLSFNMVKTQNCGDNDRICCDLKDMDGTWTWTPLFFLFCPQNQRRVLPGQRWTSHLKSWMFWKRGLKCLSLCGVIVCCEAVPEQFSYLDGYTEKEIHMAHTNKMKPVSKIHSMMAMLQVLHLDYLLTWSLGKKER